MINQSLYIGYLDLMYNASYYGPHFYPIISKLIYKIIILYLIRWEFCILTYYVHMSVILVDIVFSFIRILILTGILHIPLLHK